MCINRLVKLNPVNFDEEVLCSDIPVLGRLLRPLEQGREGSGDATVKNIRA